MFLGTSGSVPTAKRGLAGTLVPPGGERILVDCGEGTQRQLLRSNVGLVELPEIFLTHYHADHYLGLPGMLKTFALRGREVPLTVYGPPGLIDLFGVLQRVFGKLTYEVDSSSCGRATSSTAATTGSSPSRWSTASRRTATRSSRTPRPGRFDVEAAEALGVPEGPLFGRLQAASRCSCPTGARWTPSRCSALRGRAGRSSSPATRARPRPVLEAAQDADVLVHEATFASRSASGPTRPLHATATARPSSRARPE